MSPFSIQSNLSHLKPGTLLRVNCGLYDHVVLLGEYSVGGERKVLSFGNGSVGFQEIPFSTFASGRGVYIDGYLGSLPPEMVLRRAREAGQLRYSWLFFNCEHFVRHAHSVPVESPQLQRALLLAGVSASIFKLAKP